MKTALMVALSLAVLLPAAQAEEASPVPVGRSEVLATFAIKDARQAVGVDAEAFYAIDNTVIAKFEKASGKPLARWEGPSGGPIIHLDSAAVIDGRIYTAHSNYPEWPMTSSLEVWDAATLKHVESHSFGIDRGSLTWIDRDAKGQFWAASPITTECSTRARSLTATSTTPRSCASTRIGGWPRPMCCRTTWLIASPT